MGFIKSHGLWLGRHKPSCTNPDVSMELVLKQLSLDNNHRKFAFFLPLNVDTAICRVLSRVSSNQGTGPTSEKCWLLMRWYSNTEYCTPVSSASYLYPVPGMAANMHSKCHTVPRTLLVLVSRKLCTECIKCTVPGTRYQHLTRLLDPHDHVWEWRQLIEENCSMHNA